MQHARPPQPGSAAAPWRRAGRRRLHLQLLALIASALLLWVDPASVWQALAAMPPLLLGAALLIATADRFMMGFKWRHLVRAGGGRLRLLGAVSAYYQSAFSGKVFPIGMGQDVLRAYLVARMGVPTGLLVGSMAVEKLLAALASTLLALLGVLYLAAQLPDDLRGGLLLAAGVVVTLVTGALLLSFHSATHRLGGRLLRDRLPEKLAGGARRASQSLLAYRHRPGTLAVNLLLAVGEHLLQLLKFFVLGRALGVTLPFLPFLATIAVVLFARRVTAYFEGWGAPEATSVILFTLLGLERHTAVALALANYAVTLVATLPGGYLLYRSSARQERLGREAGSPSGR